MRDQPRPAAPRTRIGVWIDPEHGCAVYVSHVTGRLIVDSDDLALQLGQRGLALRGVARSTREAAPPGLAGLVEAPWDGGDFVAAVLALVPERSRPAAPVRSETAPPPRAERTPQTVG